MKKIAKSLGGTFIDNPLTNLDKIIAVHPLGGCCMSDQIENGVPHPSEGQARGQNLSVQGIMAELFKFSR